MKRNEAIKRARKLAKTSGYDYFIVTEPDWRGNFHPVREDQLDTWFLGCPIHACVDPTGTVHE